MGNILPVEVPAPFDYIIPVAVTLIIFDLDGTLADTAIDTADALNEAIRPFDLPPASIEEVKAAMGGAEDGLMHRLFNSESGLDWPSFRSTFARTYAARLTIHTKPYPGVRGTLKKLSRWRKVVFSNKSASLTVTILDHFGLMSCFDRVLGGDSGSGRKPNPEPILHILSQFHARPEEAIMVGDCIYDVDAGRAAGVRTVAVTYGYGVGDFADKADFVIDRFSRLPDIVKNL